MKIPHPTVDDSNLLKVAIVCPHYLHHDLPKNIPVVVVNSRRISEQLFFLNSPVVIPSRVPNSIETAKIFGRETNHNPRRASQGLQGATNSEPRWFHETGLCTTSSEVVCLLAPRKDKQPGCLSGCA